MAGPIPLCDYYHRGRCFRGSQCDYLHPANLDPNLPKEIDYQVCNELGQGCRRCLQAGYSCDKKDRDHDDPMDPCSECRHFGGPGCKCILLKNTSMNDMLYPVMLNGHDREPQYSLPKLKGREEPKKDGTVPGPMLADEIKSDWTGISKVDLLATPDMLPPQVRRRPRAYLVPPRETNSKRKKRDWHASHPPSGNITSSAMSFASSLGPMQHMMVSMPQPSAIPLHMPIISTTVHWPTLQAMPVYYTSQTMISPSMPGYPVAHAMSSAWVPQSMASPRAPLPINRVPSTRNAGYTSGLGMPQARQPRPSVRHRPAMPTTTVPAANTRHASGSNDFSSNIVDARPAKRSRTEATATTTRVKEWVQDAADVKDNMDATSESSASTMWRP
ncbi:hypothetical protein KCU95_g6770, partial [Aureobasidium melanogenum]